jgi:hypothetical protein
MEDIQMEEEEDCSLTIPFTVQTISEEIQDVIMHCKDVKKKQKYQTYILDGLNNLRENMKYQFEDSYQLQDQTKKMADLMKRLAGRNRATFLIVLKSFSIGTLNNCDVLNVIFYSILTYLPKRVQENIKIEFKVIDGLGECDDRLVLILQHQLASKGIKAIVVSNDRYRSFETHYKGEVYFRSYELNSSTNKITQSLKNDMMVLWEEGMSEEVFHNVMNFPNKYPHIDLQCRLICTGF